MLERAACLRFGYGPKSQQFMGCEVGSSLASKAAWPRDRCHADMVERLPPEYLQVVLDNALMQCSTRGNGPSQHSADGGSVGSNPVFP